jgi:hypothetical protein
MKIGFTGTRYGMTPEQMMILYRMLDDRWHTEFHHGDCLGADSQAHTLAIKTNSIIILHPPSNPRLRAFKQGCVTRPEKPYLQRNRDIVDETDLLIAAPKSTQDQSGGTWYTIHYALRKGKPVTVLTPDGGAAPGKIYDTWHNWPEHRA